MTQILGFVGVGFAVVFVCFLLSFAISSGHDKLNVGEKEAEELFEDNGEIVETRAEVIDMACGTTSKGGKVAKTVEWYAIIFKDDLGKVIKVYVDREMYDAFEVGMHGNLKLVDGGLYSFEAKD